MSVSDAVDGEPLVLDQRADLKSFLGLSLKNGLLNIVTLTLYRFWGKTEVRRRIWSSTYLNDEPFEYTGRGVELFIGFLLAVVVLGLPFLVAVFGAQFLGPAAAAAILLPLYLFVGFLAGFGRFTAFRYLASRTSWRGIRFLLRGSPVDYGFRYLGYGWLSGFTLGWFWPAAQRRLAAPLWNGLRFGDRKVRFDLGQARKVGVYGPFAIAWVGIFVAYAVTMGGLIGVLAATMGDIEKGAPPDPSLSQIGTIYLAFGLFALLAAVFYAPYQAAALRSVAAGISFEGVRLSLRVRWWEMAVLTITNVIMAAVTLGFLMPFVQARVAKFLVGRLETQGVADLDTVRQATDAGPRTGEGLADAFGLSPI
jgi:uncharacterized membrane protein YjgN (DUF898 family)